MSRSMTSGRAIERRLVLQFLGAGVAALELAAGLESSAQGAEEMPEWPMRAFAQKDEARALQALYGAAIEPSDEIALEVPLIAENLASVPVSVTISLRDVTSISILVPQHAVALAASYCIPEGTEPSVSCHLRMAKTGDVVAVVQSAGRLYGARKRVKVTRGGYAG